MNPCDECRYQTCSYSNCVRRLLVVVRELSEQLDEHERLLSVDAHSDKLEARGGDKQT